MLMAKKQLQQASRYQILISAQDFNDTLQNRDVILADYALQEKVLLQIFQQYPNNTNLSEVLLKVTMLNSFYSTGIMDVKTVVQHIYDLANNKGIDARIKSGDPTVVAEIANVNHGGKVICHLSFASKYCSFHNPSAYPIYDSIVWNVFTTLKKRGFFAVNTAFSVDGIKRDFSKYIAIYDEFIQLSGIGGIVPMPNYKEIDRYLWGSQKIKSLPSNVSSVVANPKEYQQIINNVINKTI